MEKLIGILHLQKHGVLQGHQALLIPQTLGVLQANQHGTLHLNPRGVLQVNQRGVLPTHPNHLVHQNGVLCEVTAARPDTLTIQERKTVSLNTSVRQSAPLRIRRSAKQRSS